MYGWTTSGHESGQHKWIYSPQGRTLTLVFLGGFLNTMMIHTRCLSVPQQNPPVVLRIPSDELFESIKGISLNRLCLQIVLLLPLDSVQWMIDLGFYPVCLLVLKQKWGYGSSKPLVCTVHENIQFSLSFHECKVLGLFRLSLRQLCVGWELLLIWACKAQSDFVLLDKTNNLEF